MTDLELLRRFEPVIRYTQGEMFFPSAVDGYLRRCRLWQKMPEVEPRLLLDAGHVTPAALAQYDRAAPGAELYLEFIDAPLDPLATQQWLNSADHPDFASYGRLARVGIGGRLAEALFDFSLLLRGRVPGGTTGKAEQQYRQMMVEDPRYVYYGRVVRDGGYTILHYMFFYAMNDWRSSFHGVNDHEADWEQIFVFVTEEDGDYVPQWVAFAAHDFSGDDLRRRWDDPELDKVADNHVVVYAAAGSHAAYIEPGEYLMHVEPAALKPLRRVIDPAREFIARSLSANDQNAPSATDTPLLPLAFVDYARGDGRAIGPEQPDTWSPELLTDDLPWLTSYHGLWGLDTQDPFGGERAPAGPKFNRDGSVRHAWSDPLGWCGLDKVPPPDDVIPETEAALALLAQTTDDLEGQIAEKRALLRTEALTVQALAGAANLEKQRERVIERLAEMEKEIAALADERAELLERERFMRDYLADVQAGVKTNPQAHLRHRAVPEPPPPVIARAMDLWAAASGLILVATIVALVGLRPEHWPLWIILSILVFGLIESTLRGRAADYLLATTIVLAAIAIVVLGLTYWRWVIPGALIGIFVYAFIDNLRELRARR